MTWDQVNQAIHEAAAATSSAAAAAASTSSAPKTSMEKWEAKRNGATAKYEEVDSVVKKHDQEFVILIDMDHFLQMVIEGLFERKKSIEKRVIRLFEATTTDGIVDFSKFCGLVKSVASSMGSGSHAPIWEEAVMLDMFRDACNFRTEFAMGGGGDDSGGAEAG